MDAYLMSSFVDGTIAPIASILGGIASQEVIKACTGVFTPTNQWLHYDALECISYDAKTNLMEDRKLKIVSGK